MKCRSIVIILRVCNTRDSWAKEVYITFKKYNARDYRTREVYVRPTECTFDPVNI